MTFDELMKSIETLQRGKSLQTFLIDKNRLQERLISLEQDLDDISIPLSAVIDILNERISLTEYAIIHKKTYSSIIQNKGEYRTIVASKRNIRYSYTICTYELYHGSRLEDYEKLLAHYIRQNKDVSNALLMDSLKQNKTLASLIFGIIKDHYKIK